MDATHTIRDAVERVNELRTQAQSNPQLKAASLAIKSFQQRRFEGTYSDLLASEEFGGAARFFLEELYGTNDYALRDAQFARVAGALQKFFPNHVVVTAVSLAQLHMLSEELDHQMALAWTLDSTQGEDTQLAILRYIRAWQAVGRPDDRERQLNVVLGVGRELDRLTRAPGLRLMLKMMRRPAVAAGLGSLQTFLELGFDTFAGMSGKGERAAEFLATIQERESVWLARLFSPDTHQCWLNLSACLNTNQYRLES